MRRLSLFPLFGMYRLSHCNYVAHPRRRRARLLSLVRCFGTHPLCPEALISNKGKVSGGQGQAGQDPKIKDFAYPKGTKLHDNPDLPEKHGKWFVGSQKVHPALDMGDK